MPTPSCSTCCHFLAEHRACRRNPPVVVVLPALTAKGIVPVPQSLFPTVHPTESVCGEHRPRIEASGH